MQEIKIDFLNRSVFILQNDDDIKHLIRIVDQAYIHEYLKDDLGDYNGLCVTHKGDMYVIVYNNTISTLTHEVLHAVLNICTACSIDDDEVKCYLITYIMKEIFKENDIFKNDITSNKIVDK